MDMGPGFYRKFGTLPVLLLPDKNDFNLLESEKQLFWRALGIVP